MKLHSVFHVSVLKRHHRNGRWLAPPPPVIIDDEAEWEVDRILEHRLVKRGRKNKVEYLINFFGYGPEHNMWQDDLSNCKELLSEYWASMLVSLLRKPESEHLFVLLVSYDAHAR